MNICFVATEIVPTKNGAFTGGLVNNVVRLAKGLSEKGHYVEIMTTDVNKSLENKSGNYSWGIINRVHSGGKYVSFQSNLLFLLKIIPAIKKVDKKINIDIIHVHSAYSIFGVVPSLVSIILGKPVIFTLYSPMHNKPLNDRKGFYQLLSSGKIGSSFLLKAGVVSCISQNIKLSLIDSGIKGDIPIIPPIIDTNIFNSQLDGLSKRRELGISENSGVIFYCGSWAKWKGVDLLIQAFHEIKKDHSDLILIMAWGEPYDWYDERKVQLSKMIDDLGLQESVVELGVVNDIQMVMAASDIFVAPFLNIDGVADPPLSLLEAMACGKIAIATKIGSIPQIIVNQENGLIIDPNDLTELIKALEDALEHKEVNTKISNNASSYVFENYGTDAVINKLLSIYNDLRV